MTGLNDAELLILLLGISGLIFQGFHMESIRKVFRWKLLLSAYSFLVLAWFATNLEAFILPVFLNILEHTSYLLSALLFLTWSLLLNYSREKHV